MIDPEQYAAFPIGDTIPIVIHYDAEFYYEPNNYSWDEEYIWNTSEPPNLGSEWTPGFYQLWPVEYAWDRGFYYEENESRIYCLFVFEILENLVKKYFNPLKPDSARVVYQILPMQYGDPDTIPNPLKMEVEIRDKDSVLVYGPRDLTAQEQKDQVLFWDGRDNYDELANPAGSPFEVALRLTYQISREEDKDKIVTTHTSPCEFALVRFSVANDVGLKDVDDPIFEQHFNENGQLIVDEELEAFAGDPWKIDENIFIKVFLQFDFDAYPSMDEYNHNAKIGYLFDIDNNNMWISESKIEGTIENWSSGVLHHEIFYDKEVKIPLITDLGDHNFVLRFHFFYPETNEEVIYEQLLQQIFKIFFDKGLDYPLWEDYDNDSIPNWYEYWSGIDTLQNLHYGAHYSIYDIFMSGQAAGQYRPWVDETHYFIGATAAAKVKIHDENNNPVWPLAGIHAFGHTCLHEWEGNVKQFLNWWPSYAHWKVAYEAGEDRDRDFVPNTVEEADPDLDPDKQDTDGDGLNDFSEIVYRKQEQWVNEILSDPEFWVQIDLANPGKNTDPQY